MPIVPARLAFTEGGTPYSETYGDIYHAEAGGLAQARHVFLGGNGLPDRWHGRNSFVILETGFGQGLNFLAAWDAWRSDPQRPRRLHFLSVEKHPFASDDLARLHAQYPELAPLAAQLRAQWPELTTGFHRLEFENGGVALTLAFGEAIAAVPQFVGEADAIFLDGFAPARNPELWSAPLMREIALAAAPGATAATWTVAATVREALAAAGFRLEKRPGFAHKHEMLIASLADEPEAEACGGGPVAIIGAGLAGCLLAERLAARGIDVLLFERHPEPAQETSGNLTAAMLPVLSLDDARLSRLNRAAYLYALRWIAQCRAAGHAIDGEPCGLVQIARDAAHQAKQREILQRNGFPESFVRFVCQAEAGSLAGLNVAGPGWWFAGAGWANPASVCRAALARGGGRVQARYSTTVASLEPTADGWRLIDVYGGELAAVRRVVLAGATDILRLAPSAHLPIFRFRGQVSHLPATHAPIKGLASVVCREGYLTPAHAGVHCVGASFHRGGEPALRTEDHVANLARLDSMLPGASAGIAADTLGGRVAFRPVSPDKMPLVGTVYPATAQAQGRDLGAIDRVPGLFVASGYGARGLVWAPLMAELLASQLAGDPLPCEADLAGAVDPARFVARTARARADDNKL